MRKLAAVAILATLPGLAGAQKADLPEVKPGDRWDFVVYYTAPSTTPNRTWIVTAVSDRGIEATENGEPLRLTRDMNVLDSPQIRIANPKALDFPLEVGKRWQYASDWEFKPKGSKGRVRVDMAVEAFEKVKVPAGEFDAFRLSAKEALSGTSPIGSQYGGETTRTYWYAPAVRAIVRTISHNPYLGPSTVELVAFKVGAN